MRLASSRPRELYPPFDPQAYREGHLTPVFFGSALHNLGAREPLRRRVRSLSRALLVDASRPFGGPGQVLVYLARYLHRVAIATAASSGGRNALVA
jgi:hypothetical protein